MDELDSADLMGWICTSLPVLTVLRSDGLTNQSPTKFNLALHPNPQADSIERGPIIHVTSSELSPRIPSLGIFGTPSKIQEGYHTTFTLVIEPLILGFLPKTAIPAVFWIITFALGAGITVPYIRRRIENLVNTVGMDEPRGKTL